MKEKKMESKRPSENNVLSEIREQITSSFDAFSRAVTTLVSEYNKDDAVTWLLDILKKHDQEPTWRKLLEVLMDLHVTKMEIMRYEAEGPLSLRHIPQRLRRIYPLSCKTAEYISQLHLDEKNVEQVKDFVLVVALLLARKEKNKIDDEMDPAKTERMKGYTENRSRQDIFDGTIYRALVGVVNKYSAVRALISIQNIPGQNEQELINAMQYLDENSELRFKHYFILKYLPKQVEQLPDYKTIEDPEMRYAVQLDKKEKLHVLIGKAARINASVLRLSRIEMNQLADMTDNMDLVKSETILNQMRDLELEHEQNIKKLNETECKKTASIWDWVPILNYWQSDEENEQQIMIKRYKEKHAYLQRLFEACLRYELKKFYINSSGNDYSSRLNLESLTILADLQQTRIQKAFTTTFHIYDGVNAAGERGQKRGSKYYFWGVPEYSGSNDKFPL